MKGVNNVGTLKFQGQIGKISGKITPSFEITPCFKVPAGNGQTIKAQEVMQQLHVIVQWHELWILVYLVPVEGAYMI